MYVDRTRQVAAAVVSIPAGDTPEDPAVDILTITGSFAFRVVFKMCHIIACEICCELLSVFTRFAPVFVSRHNSNIHQQPASWGKWGFKIVYVSFSNGVNATVLLHTEYQCVLCLLSCSLGPG